eukprot:COSAG01_NODE_4519_length_4959_cov_35.814815_1_plen_370_part_00
MAIIMAALLLRCASAVSLRFAPVENMEGSLNRYEAFLAEGGQVGLRSRSSSPLSPPIELFPSLPALLADRRLTGSSAGSPVSLSLQRAVYDVATPIVLAGVGLQLDGGNSTLNWTGTAAGYPSIIALDRNVSQLQVQQLVLLCNQMAGGVIAAFSFNDASFTNVHVYNVKQGLQAFGFHATVAGVVQSGGVVKRSMITSFGFGITAYSRNNGRTGWHRLEEITIKGTWGHAICISGATQCQVLNSTISDVNINRPAKDDCVFGHGIAVDGNAGLNPVKGLIVSGNHVSGVHGIAHPNCSADPCSKHVGCETAGFRYRFEVSAAAARLVSFGLALNRIRYTQGIEVGDSIVEAVISHNTIRRIPFGYGIY